MADSDDSSSTLPSHVEDSVRSLAQLHADHHKNATRHERIVERATALLAHSWLMVALSIIVAVWVGINLSASTVGHPAVDPPPFALLSAMITVASLYLVILILAAQRRDDQLAQRREQLALELAILSEQKTAKIIQLLEEIRRDSPQLPNRFDAEATDMAQPVDPDSVLAAIQETHEEAERV
jgi:uncharacterized membrane protein